MTSNQNGSLGPAVPFAGSGVPQVPALVPAGTNDDPGVAMFVLTESSAALTGEAKSATEHDSRSERYFIPGELDTLKAAARFGYICSRC